MDSSPKTVRNGIPTRVLGRTGARVTVIGVGGYHIGQAHDERLGVRIIRQAIDEGIDFLDNAWCYNGGESERIMGLALQDGYRDGVFLMTKNHGRDAATYRAQLEESLTRLRTEVIDLVQFHEIIHEGEPGQIAHEGAIEAALEARERGLVRFIGFTGHQWPHLLTEMLDIAAPWDAVQLPINLLDAHYRSFAQRVLPALTERGIGVIAMKSLAGGRLLETGVTPAEAIGYTLSQPVHTLVTGIDSLQVLEQNLRIARSWTQQTAEEQRALLARVAERAVSGRLEYYK